MGEEDKTAIGYISPAAKKGKLNIKFVQLTKLDLTKLRKGHGIEVTFDTPVTKCMIVKVKHDGTGKLMEPVAYKVSDKNESGSEGQVSKKV